MSNVIPADDHEASFATGWKNLESHIICTSQSTQTSPLFEWEGVSLWTVLQNPGKNSSSNRPQVFSTTRAYSAQYAVRTFWRSSVFVGSHQRNPHFKEKDRLQVGFLPVRLKTFSTDI